jgi:hypothetical protein
MDLFSIFGVVVSLVSIYFAILQTLRKREVEKTLNELKRTRRADTWTNMAIVIRTFDTLDEARVNLLAQTNPSPFVLSKISSARRGTVDQWRHLLKQAILDEPDFCAATIDRWVAEGKLENEWRVNQARRLLENDKNIPTR